MGTHISEIKIGDNRQRREFNSEALVDLSRSIQNLGLLHAVVCRKVGNDVFLVAGERRLRAMQMLIELDIPVVHGDTAYLDGTVPINLITELSEELAFEAELEENIVREDLSWQDRALAIDKLHTFRSRQAFERGDTQTLRATATEIRGNAANNFDISKTGEDIIIANHLNDADVVKAPNRKEALKIIEKKAKVAHRAKLAKSFIETTTKHELQKGSCFELLKTIPDSSMDLLLTDPPYGMDASKFSSNFSLKHEYEDGWEYFLDISHMLAFQAFRILKPNTHGYIFCSFSGWSVLAKDFADAGFTVWPQPMIWAKGNGNAPWISNGHKKTYECILFVAKGSREVTSVKTDVLFYTIEADRDHGAQKPVALYADLMGRSTQPGDKVLDPFAGSGTVFPAADLCSCRALAMEMDDDSFNIALERLQGALL